MIKYLEKYIFIPIIISIIIAVFIFYMSSSSHPPGSGIKIIPFKSIVYHIGIFFLLGFFLSISIVQGRKSSKLLILLAILLAIAYGTTDEIHQFFVPGRTTGIDDLFYDSFGALTGAVLYLATIDFRRK